MAKRKSKPTDPINAIPRKSSRLAARAMALCPLDDVSPSDPSTKAPEPPKIADDDGKTEAVCEVSQKTGRVNRKNKAFRIPAPTAGQLVSALRPSEQLKALSDEDTLIRMTAEYRRTAALWAAHAPSFQVDVDLDALAARPKPSKGDKGQAAITIAQMAGWPADAASGRWYDRKGTMMVASFAKLFKAGFCPDSPLDPLSPNTLAPYPGSQSRTKESISRNYSHVSWSGLPERLCKRDHLASQELAAHLTPVFHERDARHQENADVMEYVRDGLKKNQGGETVGEFAGVLHLVHAWVMQGWTAESGLVPSADLRGRTSANGSMAVAQYYEKTKFTAAFLSEMFKVSFPDYWEKYSKAFKAGVWYDQDAGPWLGRAIVWKLQVNPHWDGLDDGPAAIFNVGKYTGGHLYLPDIGLKLDYGPGTVVIMMSGALYHAVSEWQPEHANPKDTCTPGRVGNVYFFPKKSFDVLVDKPLHWNRKTMSGRGIPESPNLGTQ